MLGRASIALKKSGAEDVNDTNCPERIAIFNIQCLIMESVS
jgi:hypothetical protein